jgi:hypothetical protein
MTAFGSNFSASFSPYRLHVETLPRACSDLPETLAVPLENLSNSGVCVSSQDHAGEGVSGVASPQEMLRELGELISPNQPAKILYPLIQHDLRRHVPDISLRRVRSIYNGEVSRLWDDESMAIRIALSSRKNSKARGEFARAAAALVKKLAAHGVPLTAAQFKIVSQLSNEVAA